eukprot:m.485487 g.485487  ORF g.485487 m.485487 type:complete len:420 (-) comp23848_c0_seq1:159-1418(-)
MKRSVWENIHLVGRDPVRQAVHKATDSTRYPPKRKHVEALIRYTKNDRVPIRRVGNKVLYRAQNGDSWVVVLKALVLQHELIRSGHSNFTRYLSTATGHLDLDGFLDSGPQGLKASVFIRRYCRFLNARLRVYRLLGQDICSSTERLDMSLSQGHQKLMDLLGLLQGLLESILDCVSNREPQVIITHKVHGAFSVAFEMSAQFLQSNFIVEAATRLLLKDALVLYALINTAISNQLEVFFTLNKRASAEVLKAMEQYVTQCKLLDEFLHVCVAASLKQSHNTSLHEAPASLLPKMQAYVQNYIEKTARTPTVGDAAGAGAAATPNRHVSIPREHVEHLAKEQMPYRPLPKHQPKKHTENPVKQQQRLRAQRTAAFAAAPMPFAEDCAWETDTPTSKLRGRKMAEFSYDDVDDDQYVALA